MDSFQKILQENIISEATVKVSPVDAKAFLKKFNGKDFFELSGSEVDDVLAFAKKNKYRKSKNAPGSTARMYYDYLTKLSRRKK
jgi:ribosomal protein L12E/L44/L45/RPP1/RPP2